MNCDEVKIFQYMNKKLFGGEKNGYTEDDYKKIKKFFSENFPAEISDGIKEEFKQFVSKAIISDIRSFLDDTPSRGKIFLLKIYDSNDMAKIEDLKESLKAFGYDENASLRPYLNMMELLGLGKVVKKGKKILGFVTYKDKMEEFWDIERLKSDSKFLKEGINTTINLEKI